MAGRRWPLAGWLAVLAFGLSAPTLPAQEDRVCLDCHQDADSDMFFDTEALARSVHSDQACIDCHEDLAGTKEEHGKVKRVDCSGCHEDEVTEYRASEHGQATAHGVKEAASCADCHGKPHAILPAGNTNAPTHYRNIPAMCEACHAKPEVMALYKPRKEYLALDYSNSVHGVILESKGKHAAVCTDCHGVHTIQRGSRTNSGMFWQNIPATCGSCHKKEAEAFATSVHGKAVAAGLRDAPVCTDCHGEHDISGIKNSKSSVSPAHIPETCGQCHGSARIASRYTIQSGVLDTYMQSFHGLAAQIGGVAAANCASCHGYHDILPSSDPGSSINPTNLPTTCGKCHQGIGTRLARGELRIHQAPGAGTDKAMVVNLVARIYIALIILIVGGMVLFTGVDYVAKMKVHMKRVRAHPRSEMRLPTFLRAQHTLLVITFGLLAYTGFVHKFPESFWSWPFRALPDGSYWRGMTHRVAGWAFTALFIVHFILLVGSTRGRQYLRHLQPGWGDATDAWYLLRRNLGWGGPGPQVRHYNFAEKAEYWALVWGSVVMIITGVMLIFTTAVLRFLPAVWLEVAQVAHYYEAVLATLAIVVWHLYWVMFDPNEYPMNTAWMIGHKKPPHEEPAPTPEPGTDEK